MHGRLDAWRSWRLGLLAIIYLSLGACATGMPSPQVPTFAHAQKAPLKVALVVSPEFKNKEHFVIIRGVYTGLRDSRTRQPMREDITVRVKLGESSIELFKTGLSQMFERVDLIEQGQDMSGYQLILFPGILHYEANMREVEEIVRPLNKDIDLGLFNLHIGGMSRPRKQKRPVVNADITYELLVTDNKGAQILKASGSGSGQYGRELFVELVRWSATDILTERFTKAFERAESDAFTQLARSLEASQELKGYVKVVPTTKSPESGASEGVPPQQDIERAKELITRSFGSDYRLAGEEDLGREFTSFTRRTQPDYLPFLCRGDFNGDGLSDLAVVVVRTSDASDKELIIFHGGQGQPSYFRGFIRSIHGIDLLPRAALGLLPGGPSVDMKGDGVKLVESESDALVIYWDGQEYQEYKEHSASEGAKLYPVDEEPKDPSFAAFRARLLQAIEQRDAGYLLSVIHRDIKLSFGGDWGIDRFREMWRPEAPDSPVWKELRDVLVLGGTFGYGNSPKHTFWAPYVFGLFPSERFDSFTCAAIVGAGVQVRTAPDSAAPVVATLSYDIVKVVYEENPVQESIGGESYPWVHILLPGGGEGYVYGRYLRSPIDYRAAFDKINGKWTLVFFVSGD